MCWRILYTSYSMLHIRWQKELDWVLPQHAIGTAKALEMGEIEGAMGGLSIAVAGILTVIVAPIFSHIF